MSDNDSEPQPIKRAPLKKYLKQYSGEMRAGSDAVDEINAELLFLAETLWREAAKRASDRDLETVQQRDVRKAYDDLFEPHELLNEAQERLEEANEDLADVSDRSPIYKDWSPYDE